MSSHPMRRGRPVVVPYSAPTSRSSSASDPWISVGYGPSPTRVVYAFTCSSADHCTWMTGAVHVRSRRWQNACCSASRGWSNSSS